jgi:hypothetical protein
VVELFLKKETDMNEKPTFVPTILYTTAEENVDDEIKKELKIDDPIDVTVAAEKITENIIGAGPAELTSSE